MNPLRPTRLADYVGQKPLVERLSVLVAAARRRGEPLSHVLLHGPPGLGKTTLAGIVAAEMGTRAHVAMAPAIEKPNDLACLLAKLGPGDVLLLDEIHRLSPATGELLYPAMEDRKLTMMVDCGKYAVPVPLDLPPFTLVGATTQPGLLEPPLRDRFGVQLSLEYYAADDLRRILDANAAKLGLSCDPGALDVLAGRARGTPRIANNLLSFARDVAAAEGDGRLTVELARRSLEMQGIDDIGLTTQDRDYLKVLTGTYQGGPVGAEAIACTMGVRPDTLVGVVEPYLLQRGLVARTRRGRQVTEAGTRHLALSA